MVYVKHVLFNTGEVGWSANTLFASKLQDVWLCFSPLRVQMGQFWLCIFVNWSNGLSWFHYKENRSTGMEKDMWNVFKYIKLVLVNKVQIIILVVYNSIVM